jgi:hypothetical protein
VKKGKEMSEINVKLEDDMQTVTLASDPPGVLKLTTTDVDSLLHALGGVRVQMQPAPPAEFSSGQQFVAAPHPSWATEMDATHGNPVLHFRDPRFGWLHYMISKEEARKLSAALAMLADSPMAFQLPDKPN